MWGEDSIEYSERVIRAYICRYATEARIGRVPTNETIARIHNGGPNGWKRKSTMAYWGKVKQALEDITNGETGQSCMTVITQSEGLFNGIH